MKKSDFASGMTSGRSQMYEIILATSLVWGETPEVEACKFSGEKSLVRTENFTFGLGKSYEFSRTNAENPRVGILIMN